jgi:hypothetical protein
MTPVTVYDVGPMGDTECPDCRQPVYIAWDDDMNRIALEPDDAGTIAVSLDGNRLPWCRDARGSQLAFGDRFYRLHRPRCTALAPVRAITSARSLRRPKRTPAAPGRRTASAR